MYIEVIYIFYNKLKLEKYKNQVLGITSSGHSSKHNRPEPIRTTCASVHITRCKVGTYIRHR